VVKKRRKERERKKERKKRKIHQTTPPEKANHLLPLTPNTLLRSIPSYQKPNTFPVLLPPKTRLLYLKPSPKLPSTDVSFYRGLEVRPCKKKRKQNVNKYSYAIYTKEPPSFKITVLLEIQKSIL
jgi:hypothetical protein